MDQNKPNKTHRHTHTTHRKTKTCVVKIVVIIQKTTKTLCIDEIKTLTLNEPLMKKEREKRNKFQQKKKPFSIFVLSVKLEKEIHPHSPENHTHQSKSTTSPTHEKLKTKL